MILNVLSRRDSRYRDVLDEQRSLHTSLIEHYAKSDAPADEHLILAEHLPVYTLGVHGHAENMLLSQQAMEQRGIECIRIERGGDITYHGPGQLTAYPIINMRQHGLGVRQYVHLLEDSVIELIGHYGIKASTTEDAPGVWLDAGTPRMRKICALGVKCRRFVTLHGLALNINTDLTYFNNINPCGFVDKGVCSIASELGHEVDFYEAACRFVEIIARRLGGFEAVRW